MENEINVYDCYDVMKLCNCSRDKAYKIIRGLNDKLIEEGVPKDSINSGKISKKFFHETLKI